MVTNARSYVGDFMILADTKLFLSCEKKFIGSYVSLKK